MCLDILFVTDLKDQIGYKVFKKYKDHNGKVIKITGPIFEYIDFKKGKWFEDIVDQTIINPNLLFRRTGNFRYPSGFHIYHLLEAAKKHIEGNYFRKDFCIFKVKYKDIVAIGKQDPFLKCDLTQAQIVIVAKKIKLLEEIPFE